MTYKLKNKRFENKGDKKEKKQQSDMFKMEISVIISDRRFVRLAWNAFNELLDITETLCVSTFSFRNTKQGTCSLLNVKKKNARRLEVNFDSRRLLTLHS